MKKKNIPELPEDTEEVDGANEESLLKGAEENLPPAEPPAAASGKVTVTVKIEAKGFYKVEADTEDLAVAHVKETPIGEFMDNVLKVQVVKIENAS